MPPEAFTFLNRHVRVSRETFYKLESYYNILVKWQNKINLVSDDSIADSWNRHFLDSLQLLKYFSKENGNTVDFGSGAGFPGMVLAITGVPNVHLIESDGKKISFLREISRVTDTPVTIYRDRMENVDIKNIKTMMARAVSDLTTLFEIVSKKISHETICLLPKGKNYAMEINDAKKIWSFSCDVFPSITDQNAVILKISNLAKK
jgi:16S rRNA (guanine527-N7)-methyltransferase